MTQCTWLPGADKHDLRSCKEGISHNPREYAKPEDIFTGIEVLAAAVKRVAVGR
jgi:acetylornithine deacetylase/succinyl-diaminopimelate desuccinylase-like protein